MTKTTKLVDANDVLPRLRAIAEGAGGDVRLAEETLEAIGRLIMNVHTRDDFLVEHDLWPQFLEWLSRSDAASTHGEKVNEK